MEPSPHIRHLPAQKAALAAEHWTALLRCALSQNETMLSIADHSSPVNTAYLILKPSAKLFAEGVAVLRRAAAGRFNVSHGWDLVGRPRHAVPRADPSRSIIKYKQMEMYTRDDWSFACGATDQGFYFYMLRVKHALGGELRRVTACQPSRQVRRRAPGLGHYAGEITPERALAPGSACGSPPPLLQSMLRASPSASAYKVARTLAWALRSRLELANLQDEVRRVGRANDSAVSTLARRCDEYIVTGVRCLETALPLWNVTVTPRFARFMQRRKQPLAPGLSSLPASDFLSRLYAHGMDEARPKKPSIFGE
jgi:hypothetical protein